MNYYTIDRLTCRRNFYNDSKVQKKESLTNSFLLVIKKIGLRDKHYLSIEEENKLREIIIKGFELAVNKDERLTFFKNIIKAICNTIDNNFTKDLILDFVVEFHHNI